METEPQQFDLELTGKQILDSKGLKMFLKPTYDQLLRIMLR